MTMIQSSQKRAVFWGAALASWVWAGAQGQSGLARAESPKFASEMAVLFAAEGRGPRLLKTFRPEDLRVFKQQTRKERTAASEDLFHWRGVLLSDVIDAAMQDMTVEERATVDLVVLGASDTAKVEIPRGFANKYPVLLAYERDGRRLDQEGPFWSVVPFSLNQLQRRTASQRGIQDELLPIEKYSLPAIRKIELTNYRNRYHSSLFLSRRTDPLMVRGEKRYVQTCLGCHALGGLPPAAALSEQMATPTFVRSKHEAVRGMPQLGDVEVKALRSYLKAIQ